MVAIVVQQEQRLFREGLAMVLGAEPDLEVVGLAAVASELVELAKWHRPDVAVLDVEPGAGSTIRTVAALRSAGTGRVVVLYRHLTRAEARGLQAAGAGVLLDRQGGMDPILRGVRGDPCTRIDIAALAVHVPGHPDPPPRLLTRRELEVLGFVGKGITSREISEALGISRKTVENHKQRTFQKLGVQNQAHAVSVAMRKGLFAPLEATRG